MKFSFLYIFIIFICCCETKKEIVKEENYALPTIDTSGVSKEVIDELVRNLPSPIEISTLIKQTGAQYSDHYLNSTSNLDKYNSQYRKALNLGVFGTDLGYINIYGKTHVSFSYLNALKDLAEDLRIGQFFNFETLTSLAKNIENVDTLIFLTTLSFQKMDNYLNEDNRGNISLLILSGAWIEALYLSTQVVKTLPSAELIERIGAQKNSLSDLVLMISAYKNYPQFSTLVQYFNEFEKVYSTVEISYTDAEPTYKEVNGILQIIDKSESIIKLRTEQLNAITVLVEKIRNQIVE